MPEASVAPLRRQPVPATVVAPVAPVAGACFTGTGSYRQFQPKASQPVYPSQAASLLVVKRQPSGHSSRVATLSTQHSGNTKVGNANFSSGLHRRPSPIAALFSTLCCQVRWSEAGRFYMLTGGFLCAAGIVTLLTTSLGRQGPVWMGPIIVCAGLILIGKGVFDYVRFRIKSSAERPDPLEDASVSAGDAADGGARRLRRRMRLVGALPFGAASAQRRRRKQLAANLRYIHGTGVSGASNTASWAAAYGSQQQHGTLQPPPPPELVQNASLLLANSNRPCHDIGGSCLTDSSGANSFGAPREPVYFPVMSSTSRLPTPQESPFPSVFSLQDTGASGAAAAAAAYGADARGRLLSTRRSSGMSAPSLFDTLRPSSSREAVVGRSRTRLPLMPSKAAIRLTSHKEEA